MTRGSLIGMIFKSSLRIAAHCGETSAKPINLMSSEIERISQTLQWVFHIIPNIIQVSIGLAILSFHLGATIAIPGIVAISTLKSTTYFKTCIANDLHVFFRRTVCGVVTGQIGRNVPARQARWMQAIQRRVGITTKVLTYIKGIKMSGLSAKVSENIQSFRDKEIQDQKSFRRLQVANIVVGT